MSKNNFESKIFFSRKYRRIPVSLEIEYLQQSEFAKAVSINISQGGIFIQSDKPLPHDEKTVVKIIPNADCEPIELNGRVAWTMDGGTGATLTTMTGMGIEFIFTDECQKNVVGEFVSRLFTGWLNGKNNNSKRDN